VNHGPLIFLAAFLGLSASWVGFVLAPQMQVGHLQQTNTVPAAAIYPLARPGLAREGLEVYRANGCAYCHSQQVGQTGTVCDVMLNEPGTNQPALIAALAKVKPELSEKQATALLASLPQTVLSGLTKEEADAAVGTLNASGARAQVWIAPAGPDIARGWGRRRTVARDYLFDYPLMLGSQRVGPDLANIGARNSDANWHLRHLYAPRSIVKDSAMPPYRYLFEKRRIQHRRSAEALELPPETAPEPGFEIVPSPEAQALAAYLVSLRADEPLYEAPFSVAMATAPPSGTNAPAGITNAPLGGIGSTNSPNINAPVK